LGGEIRRWNDGMSDALPLISILRRLEAILRRNDHPQADYVAAVATIAEWDSTAIGPALASGAMWGGAGAVWDVGQFERKDDHRCYWRLLVQLVEAMKAQGIESPSAESRAEIFSQWLESLD
jgi:hypothetical protein